MMSIIPLFLLLFHHVPLMQHLVNHLGNPVITLSSNPHYSHTSFLHQESLSIVNTAAVSTPSSGAIVIMELLLLDFIIGVFLFSCQFPLRQLLFLLWLPDSSWLIRRLSLECLETHSDQFLQINQVSLSLSQIFLRPDHSDTANEFLCHLDQVVLEETSQSILLWERPFHFFIFGSD